MSPELPVRPSLAWLRKTAKDRLKELRVRTPGAKLAEAQLAVAREHGFPSWRALKAHIDALADPDNQAAAALTERRTAAFLRFVGNGLIAPVTAMLDARPALVNVVGPHPFWGGRPQALHLAVEGKRRDMFDLLLARRADVNGTNDGYDDWSPLMLAIDRGQIAMRDELMRRGARVGLLEALLLGDDAHVSTLLEGDRLPPIRPNGGSLLALARTPFAIDRLLALGAETDVKDRWGSTPIDAISRQGSRGEALVSHLIARGVAAAPPEHARLGDLHALERLADSDPAVARDESVMMAAVDFSHHDVVRWLLARGGHANARARAQSRHTALHSAAWNGGLDMVRLLIEAGADRFALDEQYNSTPRGWADTAATVTNNPACADVVKYLDALDASGRGTG